MTEFNDYAQLLNYLQNNSDDKFDKFNKKIVNSQIDTIGCTVPFIRRVARSCSLDFVLSLPVNQYVEIDLLRGIKIASAKLTFDIKSKLLTAFADTIENWAVCDCSVVKPDKEDREHYFQFFCGLTVCNSVFKCRYGIVNLLANYLDEDHIDTVLALLGNVGLWGNYYVDMSAAWLIATAMVKCRCQTKQYMENDGRRVLNKFAYNKALQKIRDSRQISIADKQWTYALKMA